MPSKRILIIDDEADIREVAALALEAVGNFEVTAATDGYSGLAAAQRERPDLILLDVMMPGLDGPSTCRLLQASAGTRSIPIIFLTAKVQAADRRTLTDIGARGILSKPFDPMRLPGDISAIVGWA